MNVFNRLKGWSDSRGISQQKIPKQDFGLVSEVLLETHSRLHNRGISGYVLNKLEELQEYAEAMHSGYENDAVDAVADSAVYDATEMVKMGYSIEKTLAEALLVIESRTGEWDDSLGKFAKDKSPEAKAKWYTPDYITNCKLPTNVTGNLFEHGEK